VLVQYFAGSAYITVQYINSAETRDMGMGPRTGTHWPAALLPRLAARLANDRPATAATADSAAAATRANWGAAHFTVTVRRPIFVRGCVARLPATNGITGQLSSLTSCLMIQNRRHQQHSAAS